MSDPDYNSAFWKRLADPNGAQHNYTAQEAAAVRTVTEIVSERTLAEGAPGTGGVAVPVDLDPTILLSSDGSLNPLRQLATVSTTHTNVWTGVSSEGITASFANELTEVGDNSPALVQPRVDLCKAHAFVPFSIEIGQDWGSLQNEMAKLFADAKDNLEASKFVSGTVAPEPQGIITGGTITVATAGTATLGIADVYALEEAVGPRFQPRAAFVGSNAIANRVYRLAGGGSTEPPPFNETRDRILGKPFYELSTMDTATTSGKKVLVYGDIAAAYRIVDRIGLSVELIPHLFGAAAHRPIGARGLYAYWRVGATVQVPNAIRVLRVT